MAPAKAPAYNEVRTNSGQIVVRHRRCGIVWFIGDLVKLESAGSLTLTRTGTYAASAGQTINEHAKKNGVGGLIQFAAKR